MQETHTSGLLKNHCLLLHVLDNDDLDATASADSAEVHILTHRDREAHPHTLITTSTFSTLSSDTLAK